MDILITIYLISFTFDHPVSSQKEYTVAAYKNMLSLGPMEKGDWLCINMDQHSGYKKFDTKELMQEHWL